MTVWDWFFGKPKNQLSGSPSSPNSSMGSPTVTPSSTDTSFLNLFSIPKSEVVMKTSESHPLDIERLPEDVMQRIAFREASLGIHMCPGRNKRLWRRDLHADIAKLKEANVDCVVTLVREVELDTMQLGAKRYFETLQEHGFETYHFPIRDKFIPTVITDLCETIDWIRTRLSEGKHITVHCNGGKGRAGTITACLLVSCGIDPVESIRIVQSARGGSLRNPLQQLYIRRFKSAWESFIKSGKARSGRLSSTTISEKIKVQVEEEITPESPSKVEKVTQPEIVEEKLLDLDTVNVNISEVEIGQESVYISETFGVSNLDTDIQEKAPRKSMLELIEGDSEDEKDQIKTVPTADTKEDHGTQENHEHSSITNMSPIQTDDENRKINSNP